MRFFIYRDSIGKDQLSGLLTSSATISYNNKMPSSESNRQIFSVSELNRSVRQFLETHMPLLWVEGEISNFVQPSSGHWYLTLKDNKAQVRCAMFRNSNQRVNFKPENGIQVVVRCRVGLYEGRGDYQLIIEHMEEAGFGALQRKFELLKEKLSTEGLFKIEHKQQLPATIQHIGVITSATGAAIHDIISVLNRRFPAIKVTLIPVAVQGDLAATQISEAIALANKKTSCDVLVVGRGGGSLEDLWPFNEELVARAISNSRLPIVSAVGHEVDFTIADFVADVRAPTPSAAAELLSPDRVEMLNQFEVLEAALGKSLQRKIAQLKQQTTHLHNRLQHPGKKLQQQGQQLDHLEIRLQQSISQKLQAQHYQFNLVYGRLNRCHPKEKLQHYQQQFNHSVHELSRACHNLFQHKQNQWQQSMVLLETVSPLKTLNRGYAIVSDPSGRIVKSIDDLEEGDQLTAKVVDGEISCSVTSTRGSS